MSISKREKYTKESIEAKIHALGHTELTIDFSTYSGVNKKAKFIDKDYGEFWAYPSNVIFRKSRHMKRASKKRGQELIVSIENIKEKIITLYGDIITIDEKTYINGKTKARFIDAQYGEFWARPDQLGYIKGHPSRGHQSIKNELTYSFDEAYSKIKDVWGEEIKLIKYNGFNTLCLFSHAKYGEWNANYNNVLKGHSHPNAGRDKYKKTMTRLYGAEHPSQCESIHRKMSAGRHKTVFLTHWKTGENIKCTGSYEFAVLNKLNQDRINYKCQVKIELGEIDGVRRVYYCDLYLIDEDKYIEIKGWFERKISQDKWNLFHIRYPNSELWKLKEISEFTGKTAYRMAEDFFGKRPRKKSAKKLDKNKNITDNSDIEYYI